MAPKKKTRPIKPVLPASVLYPVYPPPDPHLSAEGRAAQGLRTALLDLMRLTSEEEWVMGWALDLEFKLWLCAEGRWNCVQWQRSASLRELAKLTGGWWAWGEKEYGPVFLLLEEWLPMFATWEQEGRQEVWWEQVRPASATSE